GLPRAWDQRREVRVKTGSPSELSRAVTVASAPATSSNGPPGPDPRVAQVIREMSQCWQRGERPTAEEFLARYPELARQPEAAIDLIYEEACLRQDAGLPVDEADFLRRCPQWRRQLEALLRCDRILRASSPGPSFPAVGETVGDFRLLAELGRGMQGRVFLATQPSLADRPVVLKITPRDG